jgi:hypothetical protein
MNHLDEEGMDVGDHASVYSNSFGAARTPGTYNGAHPIGSTNIGSNVPLLRTHTISHNAYANQRTNSPGANHHVMNSGILANNIFMNDSAPNLFQ